MRAEPPALCKDHRVALGAIDAPEEHYAGIAEDLELDLDDPLATLAARTEAV
jgi:hypothetical protein